MEDMNIEEDIGPHQEGIIHIMPDHGNELTEDGTGDEEDGIDMKN